MLIFLLTHIIVYINKLQKKNKKNMISKYDIFLLNLQIVRIFGENHKNNYMEKFTISIDSYITEFKQILNSTNRLIFSRRFGDGKTYFLNEFKEKTKRRCIAPFLYFESSKVRKMNFLTIHTFIY